MVEIFIGIGIEMTNELTTELTLYELDRAIGEKKGYTVKRVSDSSQGCGAYFVHILTDPDGNELNDDGAEASDAWDYLPRWSTTDTLALELLAKVELVLYPWKEFDILKDRHTGEYSTTTPVQVWSVCDYGGAPHQYSRASTPAEAVAIAYLIWPTREVN